MLKCRDHSATQKDAAFGRCLARGRPGGFQSFRSAADRTL